jgi:hypothetical protein
MLKQVEGDVLANTGCSIKLVVKAMESCFTKQHVGDDEQLIDDDFAAETFVGAYGTENFRLCECSIYLFNKKNRPVGQLTADYASSCSYPQKTACAFTR